ncbi:glycosyltransferase family 2 protein [Bacillus alkalicellulosilyticus]|uniref:glycosyltransferase family 2 protein n=1 Tax=Alkalihalobacterium alkalicellulosilyticum TaxID=1912214 RepID=UPI000996E06E|nr:glycosyltransferase family 2 protein [Bacillus alkalicellulosilyticus]
MEDNLDHAVSIIIPVYNSEKYISKCLDSILSQTYRNIEIILINDGSTDKSRKIIESYQEKDKRIVVYHQENAGPSESRNQGLTNSKGQYIVFIDSDDTVHENHIQSLVTEMNSTNADIVCCGYFDISHYGTIKHNDFDKKDEINTKSMISKILQGTGGVLWAKIYRRDIIQKFNLRLDNQIYMSEDMVFVLNYILYCKKFSILNEYLYYYNRLNQNSISSNITSEYVGNIINVCRHLEQLLKVAGIEDNLINAEISKRIQTFVVQVIESQYTLNGKQKGNAINNLTTILKHKYIKENLEKCSIHEPLYKPYIYMLRNELLKPTLFYSIVLNRLRDIKRKISRKKVTV